MEILTAEGLSFCYPGCSETVLRDVSFSLEAGDFLAVCGATGSGKSTLLRMLKRELTPLGDSSGEVKFRGQRVSELSSSVSAAKIGFVMQQPKQQTVTDRVWHELAFSLENMGADKGTIRRRVAEVAGYFGIEDIFDKDVNELSGGQLQLVNLASVMTLEPDILILDEPTAQLDPIAATQLLSTVAKLNWDLGLTVIIVEHRLEEVIPACNKLMVLEKGEVRAFGTPREVCRAVVDDPRLFESLPTPVKLFGLLNAEGACPLTVGEGRRLVAEYKNKDTLPVTEEEKASNSKNALELKDVFFRYSRHGEDVLKGLSLSVKEGESLCILGGNGSGKSTALSAAAGLVTPYAGKIKVFGKKLSEYKGQALYDKNLALLPQDVQTMFLRSTVAQELADSGTDTEKLPFELGHLLNKHPYDLSGGEQQLTALAKVLGRNPRLLLLDEPTKGVDAYTKLALADIIRKLTERGVTVVTVTHDVEFAARVADRCALLFRGQITCCEPPHPFFSGNSFYTTAASRVTRGILENVISVHEAARLLGGADNAGE